MRTTHWMLLGCLLPLAACSSTPAPSAGPPAPPPPPPHVAGPGPHPHPGPGVGPADAATCRPDGLSALVGKTASQDVVDKAVRDSGARHARVVKPGMAVTMDFREDRLTMRVDADNRIEGASCG